MTHRTHPLQNKVAIVIDAAHGIGAELAHQLAHAGALVVVHYRAVQRQAAHRVEEEIFACGGRAWAVPANPYSASDLAFLLEQTQQGFGTPDIIIAFESNDDMLRQQFGTHAEKVWLLSDAAGCTRKNCTLPADASYALVRIITQATRNAALQQGRHPVTTDDEEEMARSEDWLTAHAHI